MGKQLKQWQTLFSLAPKSLHMVTAAMNLRCLLLKRIAMTHLDSILKNRDIIFSTKFHLVKAMVFPVVMYGCEGKKESWAPKNWCFWTVVLEKTLQCPVVCQEIQPVNRKGNQSWIFIGKTDAKVEAPIFCPLMWRADSLENTHWESFKAGGERDNREWDCWMTSLTRWAWVWASFGS